MMLEENEKRNKKLMWLWVAMLFAIFVFSADHACELRSKNPKLEENAYLLSCNSE